MCSLERTLFISDVEESLLELLCNNIKVFLFLIMALQLQPLIRETSFTYGTRRRSGALLSKSSESLSSGPLQE